MMQLDSEKIKKVYLWILVLFVGMLSYGFDIESSVGRKMDKARFGKYKESFRIQLDKESRQFDEMIDAEIKQYPQCSRQESEYIYKFTIKGRNYNMYFKNDGDANELKANLQKKDRQIEDVCIKMINQAKRAFRGAENYARYISEVQGITDAIKNRIKTNVRMTKIRNLSYEQPVSNAVQATSAQGKTMSSASSSSSQWNYASLLNSTPSNPVPYLNNIVKRASNPLNNVFYGGNNSSQKQKQANNKRLKNLSVTTGTITKSASSAKAETDGRDVTKSQEEEQTNTMWAYDDSKIASENERYSRNKEKLSGISHKISMLNENDPQDMDALNDLKVASIKHSVENALIDALRKKRELQKTNEHEEQISDEGANKNAPGKTLSSARTTSEKSDSYANNQVVAANNQKTGQMGRPYDESLDHLPDVKPDLPKNAWLPYLRYYDHLPDVKPEQKQQEVPVLKERLKERLKELDNDSLKFLYDMSILSDQAYLRKYDHLNTTDYRKIAEDTIISTIPDSCMLEIAKAINDLNAKSKEAGVINGFSATLYYNDITGQYVIGCRGSEVPNFKTYENLDDWITNFTQFMGEPTHQYASAYTLGRLIMKLDEKDREKIVITGHSLGGGLASAIGSMTGCKTTTFNAAGLSDKTIEHFAEIYAQDNMNDSNETNNNDINVKEIYERFKNNQNNITAYYSEDDFLSILQDQGIGKAVEKVVEAYPGIVRVAAGAEVLAITHPEIGMSVAAVAMTAVAPSKIRKGLAERVSYLKNQGVIPKAVGNRVPLGKAGPHTMDKVIEKTKEDSKEIRQIWQNYKKSYSALSRE